MYSPFKLTAKYLKYRWSASNAKGHGVHSPFVYDLIRNVLMDQRNYYAFEAIEFCRVEVLNDKRVLSKKYCQLIFRIINYYSPKNILEIGSSLGITTSYLAAANAKATVHTLQEAYEIAAIAESNFKKMGLNNISMIKGEIDITLPAFLETENSLDFVFVNGGHRQEPILRYFQQLLFKVHENAIILFADIHLSEEMEAAWKEIQDHPQVMFTVDLFFIGLVFFRKEMKVKQHFSIKF